MFINDFRFGIFSGKENIKQSIKNVIISDWTLIGNEYTTNVTHNLRTDNLTISIFKDNTSLSMNNIEIIDSNTIKIYNGEPMNCKIVILAKE